MEIGYYMFLNDHVSLNYMNDPSESQDKYVN